MNIVFDTYQTLALASFVLLLGFFLVKRIRVLQTFNIPEPVVGGFIVAIALTILYKVNGTSFTFEKSLQTSMMLVFFSSIGLSANFARLIKGGKTISYLPIGGSNTHCLPKCHRYFRYSIIGH